MGTNAQWCSGEDILRTTLRHPNFASWMESAMHIACLFKNIHLTCETEPLE